MNNPYFTTKNVNSMLQIANLILYSCRILTAYYVKVIDNSILFMNNHHTRDVPKETLFQPDGSWTTVKMTPYHIFLRT